MVVRNCELMKYGIRIDYEALKRSCMLKAFETHAIWLNEAPKERFKQEYEFIKETVDQHPDYAFVNFKFFTCICYANLLSFLLENESFLGRRWFIHAIGIPTLLY